MSRSCLFVIFKHCVCCHIQNGRGCCFSVFILYGCLAIPLGRERMKKQVSRPFLFFMVTLIPDFGDL